jgi:hypothetical protein
MRIPSSIAQQVGALFQVANRHENVERTLDTASEHLSGALAKLGNGDRAASIVDATTAESLLKSINGPLDRGVLESVSGTISATMNAVSMLAGTPEPSIKPIVEQLETGIQLAGRGAELSADVAQSSRAEAEELQAQYL